MTTSPNIKSIDAIIQACEDAGANDLEKCLKLESGQTLNFIYGHACEVKREIKKRKAKPPTTSPNIERIKELLDKASKYPWFLYISGTTIEIRGNTNNSRDTVVSWVGFDSCDKRLSKKISNARLMQESPELLQWCIDEIEKRDAVKFPPANEEDRKKGWTIDLAFIKKILNKAETIADQYDITQIGLEEVEIILQALQEADGE